jgi:hypothetical protein
MFGGIPNAIVLGLLRHVLTALGGVLVSKGVFSADLFEQLIGALMTIVGGVWSAAQKVQDPPSSTVVNTGGTVVPASTGTPVAPGSSAASPAPSPSPFGNVG